MAPTVTDPAEPHVAASTRRRWLVAGLAAVAVATIVAVLALGHDATAPPVAAAAPAPTTTSPTTSTTAPAPTSTLPPIPDVGRWDTTIASAVGASLEAFAELPSGTTVEPVGTLVRRRQQGEAGWAAYDTGPASGEIPALGHPVEGRERTSTGWLFTNPSGWGDRLTFTVTENHGEWLKVMLPVRPNGTEGWIRMTDVTLSHTRFHVHIAVNARTLTVSDGDTEILSTAVVVGRDGTATPRGRFFVTDAVEKHSGSSYGPWILPLSGFSQALEEFAGGAPVIAIHGTNHPELAGTASSNGCIRVPSDATITRMRDQLPQGTPVDITD